VEYAFVFGPVAVTVESCTCPEGDLEAGARIELRRVLPLPGNRPGNEGFQVLPVAEGGLWRADLLVVVDPPTRQPRHHHHPRFEHGDVGDRVFDPALMTDPRGWTIAKLADLRNLLLEVGAADIVDTIDYDDVARALPAIRAAIDSCMVQPYDQPTPR
jgi:hypothetical protein